MMFSLHGRPADVDAFQFHLAEKLGRTVGELADLPYDEYVGWQAYFTAKAAIEGTRK